MDLMSIEDERKLGDYSDVWGLRSWMNNNAIDHIKNHGGEPVDLWKSDNLYLSCTGL